MSILIKRKNNRKRIDFTDLFVQIFFIGLLVVASFFGGDDVRAIPFYVVQMAIYFGGLVFCFLAYKNKDSGIIVPKAFLLFLGFLIIIFIQFLPLPRAIISVLSPKTTAIYRTFLPAETKIPLVTFSLYPFATYFGLLKLISYLMLFFLMINIIKSRTQIRILAMAMITVATILTFYGTISKRLAVHDIGDAFGTFTNKNYYAGFTLLAIPLCLGFALAERLLYKKLVFIFLATILSVSIVLSSARAAILGLLCAVSFMAAGLVIVEKQAVKFTIGVFLIAVIAISGFLYIVNTDEVAVKFKKISVDFSARAVAYKESFAIIKDYPLLGVGLGNYGEVSGIYHRLPIRIPDSRLHNDHLQIIVETGIVGAFFCWLFFLLICKDIVRQLTVRKDPFIKYLLLGGLGSLTALAVHSFFETLFPVLAISFLFWFILALIYKGGYISARADSKDERATLLS